VAWVEGDGNAATKVKGFPAVYYDAVGDLALVEMGPYPTQVLAEKALADRKTFGQPYPNPYQFVERPDGWYAWNPKYGPSISEWQIRGLRDPNAYSVADRVRVAEKLRDPHYSSGAAFTLFKAFGWTIWSAYKNQTYLQHVGKDYQLVSGHPRAADWSK
jgi:hypothetical protein